MFTKTFWKAAFERAIKSGVQFVLYTLGVGVTAGAGDGVEAQVVNAFALDGRALLGAFLGGIILSILTSLLTAGLTDGSPSAIDAEVLSSPAPGGRLTGSVEAIPPWEDGPAHRKE